MKKNIQTSSAISVERQEKRDDFYKRIEELCGDANDLWERIDELRSELEEYLTDLEEDLDEDEELDEEDEELQKALGHISEAANEIGEGSYSMDCAYEDIN